MNIIVFGPPGAGKGTQSALLIERKSMKQISTGDLFRFNIKNETSLGLEAKSYTDKGNLVPDSVTIGMVDQEMENVGEQNFILDGFPRTVNQAEALMELLEKRNKSIGKVVFFDVPKSLLLGRLTGRRVCKGCGATFHMEFKPTKNEGVCDHCGCEVYQRADDSEEAIQNRLNVYSESTAPVKEFYQSQGKLVEIDGTGGADEVYKRLEAVLES